MLKSATLAALAAALILAACQSQPNLSPTVERPRGSGLAQGIDLPTDASDVLGEIKGTPLHFVARYYREPTSRWPTLSGAEVQRLSSLGINIVAIWESHSHRPDYFSYASGYSDALSAARQARAVAQPPGSAIYFAVDFNARGAELPQVDQYFRGVAAGLAAVGKGKAEYRVGVYGSGSVCDAVKRAGLAQYSWLSGSRAWIGSSGYTGWNIRQGTRFAQLSFNHDANEAKGDYGGFRLAGSSSTRAADAASSPETPQSDQRVAAAINPPL